MPRARKNDKRDRLINAADHLIYEKTFHTTTLADIAKIAEVPLGNVYYYFKTKDAIMAAVIDQRLSHLKEHFSRWETQGSIRTRLAHLLDYFIEQRETLAQFGCPIGSLCQELGKHGGTVSLGAAKLMQEIVTWATQQFVAAGHSKEDANALGEHYISLIQGSALLTLTFKDPTYLERQTQTIKAWIAQNVTESAEAPISAPVATETRVTEKSF